ncbi:hypothetical protein AWE51_08680 [Aquimarina aggregata]|uniref:Uncharacterized protein n=1 Tax=Aquimarina aggregata TaxID=1642818 RepID=A0A162ZD01_9FLAO|nr:DUF6304 family protein [Aquimarina aggregata]KZS39716.1 hypothetical protein AWE51_08680 [Aquimarina aggregata]
MQKIVTYKAIYKDRFGEEKIEVVNDFETLSFQLGNLKFKSNTFDFELENYQNYSKDQLQRFTFNKIPYLNGGYCYDLCNCEFTFFIPISILSIKNQKIIERELVVSLELGKSLKNGSLDKIDLQMSIELDSKIYKAKGMDFEHLANNLLHQFKGFYRFKNCFGCQFSDYSVYGQDIFGTMLCFKNQKKEYNEVKSKEAYLDLEREDKVVQEIFLCEEFEVRQGNTGYRG